MVESISDFMERRRREAAQLGRWAEGKAYDAYKAAIRSGEELRLASPYDLVRHGANLLNAKPAPAKPKASGEIRSARPSGKTLAARVNDSPRAKQAVATLARTGGNAVGVIQGGVHAVEGLVGGGAFLGRLVSPYDMVTSPPGQSAAEQLGRAVLSAGRTGIDYVEKGLANPAGVVLDLKNQGQRWRRELDPSATPVAPTLAGEVRRNFDIGRNQGEVVFDAASLFFGGPAAKTVKGLPRVSNVGNVQRYIDQGFGPKAAAHLAKPYPSRGMGHHFVKRKYRLPEWYSDGVFNVLKPDGISRGDLYELHYMVDNEYYGGKVADERWSGRALGLNRYGLPGRVWHGSPPPLKARVTGIGTAAYMLDDDEAGW